MTITMQLLYNYYRDVWDVYSFELQISSNGLLSFMRPFRAWWATPIPFGRYRDPIIAPYWSDIDFRNGLPNTGVYYRIYRNGDMNDRRTSLVLQEFSRRLATYTNEENIDFIAEWLMVVTWKDGTPYYGRANRDEVKLDMHGNKASSTNSLIS